ncbi:MAG: glycosyltransferase, partial [Candidatus Margulisiibacteriota bacterium]
DQIKEKKRARGQRIEIRKRHQIPAEAKILLFSGRLSEEKNVPFLLKAFDAIRAQEKDVYFILVGGGPKEKEYRGLARSFAPRIIFAGQRRHSDVLDYYLAADLFVYASTTETQGLVLTEAKACGLPVVAVFGGGLSDVIENGIDGYLVPQNQENFVEHVLRLLRDDKLRRGLSIKAEEDAHLRFSSAMVAKKMENVYNSLISKRRGI